MNILAQILSISSKKLLINQFVFVLKDRLHTFIDNFNENKLSTRYVDLFLDFQKIFNDIYSSFFVHYFEFLDMQFKNSTERKEKYFINKSNVERTIITIFGTTTFKRTLYQNKITGKYYFYLDDLLGIEAYRNYDPLIRAILVSDSVLTNPNHSSSFSSLNSLHLKSYLTNSYSVPKQTIYKFIQEFKIRPIQYNEISHEKTLYVMVDEKWIHKQDKKEPNKKKWIMSKVFVTFTGIDRKGKRSRLKGRHIFMTSSKTPWKDFMNEVDKIYDFEKLENINLLSDAGSWILSGAYEMKLYSNNKITINTCEFHVKQKINRSTTNNELRFTIANIIYELEDKKEFIKEMDKLIESKIKESRKQKITEYKNYILRHWKGIINMKHSLCKSSMEAHIEHCVASHFSSVPKAYSEKNIEIYLKLQEMHLNNINIIDYYLKTYNSEENYIYNNEKEINFSIFEKKSISNIACARNSSTLSKALYGLAHS